MSVAASDRRPERGLGAQAVDPPASRTGVSTAAAPALSTAFESFSRASASLEQAYAALRERVEELSLRLRETEAQLEDTKAENRRLQEAAARRTRLEAMGRMAAEIAHEIRNPLGSLELTAGLLIDDIVGDPRRHELGLSILDGIRALTRVTGNLLTFTRSVVPRLQALEARECLERTGASIAAACAARGVSLSLRSDGEPELRADPELVQQILLNLAQNALEAMSDGGTLTLGAAPRPRGGCDLRVADTGSGIDPEVLSRVFDPFFTTRAGGTGLGLPIAFRLTEAQGARIEIHSEPGRGTEVTLAFPPSAPEALPSADRRSAQ